MTFERAIATAFAMDDAAWLRHANPWSVWTRAAALPLWIAALWSRTWLGWRALVPVAIAALWTWWNPRLFPRPVSTDNWASKGVMGERIWLNRDKIPVPTRHRVAPHVLSTVAAVGGLVLVWGVVELDVWPTSLGTALAMLGKLWFVDRMVWLYEDMKDATPEYRSWRNADEPRPAPSDESADDDRKEVLCRRTCS